MTNATKDRPAGVTVLALLCFIAAAFYVFGTLFLGARVLNPLAGLLLNPLAGIFVIVAFGIALVYAGLFVAIGIGLLKMQNWARLLLIVLSGLLILGGARGLVTSAVREMGFSLGPALFVIASGLGLLIYLFTPRVKEAFRGNRF